jgi:hypothetical protein
MKTRKTFDISQFRKLAFSCAVLLAGCASAPPQRVEVPVFTPCVNVVPQRPAYEFNRLAPAATDGEIILALARDWPQGRKYEAELEAVVEGCH